MNTVNLRTVWMKSFEIVISPHFWRPPPTVIRASHRWTTFNNPVSPNTVGPATIYLSITTVVLTPSRPVLRILLVHRLSPQTLR